MIIKFFIEVFNRIFKIKNTYKCIVYIDNHTNEDKLVDTFQIKDYSYRLAYKTAYDMLRFKYPTMGLDIRIHEEKANSKKTVQ